MNVDATRASLLSRVRNTDDQAAWREFESRYADLIARYARVRGLQPTDVDDIRQIVFLNLSRSLRNFQYSPSRGRFRDYLGRVVRNAVSAWFSRPRDRTAALDSYGTAELADDGDAEPDEVWEREWVDHHYRLALETIRQTFQPQSVTVFERLLTGATVEETALAFDLSPDGVHKIKQRIRKRMTELIALQIREEDEPDDCIESGARVP